MFFDYICIVSKAERTRQFIIEKTAPLFNCKGYEGTSLNDLTAATGLTKGAIYGNFEDKEEIANEVFAYSMKTVKEFVQSRIDKADTYRGKLEAVLDFYAEYVFNPPIPGGCPLFNTAVEADDQFPKRRKLVAREMVKTVEMIEHLIEQGIRSGEFGKSVNSRKLAYVFFCTIEGGLMFARAERSEEPMRIVVQHCRDIVKQISKQI